MPSLWIFNHYAIAPGDVGGTRSYDLAKELKSMGWEVTIFAATFNHQTRRQEHFDNGRDSKIEDYNGIRFVWVKTPVYNGNGLKRIINMLAFYGRSRNLANAMTRPDAVIGSSVHPFAALAAYETARHHKSHFLFEVRDLWPQTLVDIGSISPKHPLVWALRRLERFLYRRAQKIIVLLPRAADYLLPLGVPPSKIVYLPNGVDLTRYDGSLTPLPSDLENILTTLPGKMLVAYTGSHGLANGLDTLVDAAASLRDGNVSEVHFLLVGDGPEKKRLQKRVNDEGLSNVTFCDSIPKESIPSLLKRVDIGIDFTIPSPLYRFGISPNKDFDYMAAGLPILMSGTAVANPVEECGGIVLPEGGAKTVAEALIRLAGDRNALPSIGRRAREYAEKNHSMAVLGRRLSDTLASVIGSEEDTK